MQSRQQSRGPVLWPLALTVVGVILLLDNFLLLEGFNVAGLLPLLLVIAGAQILLRGDIIPDEAVRTFAITRGSVESGTVEVSAGEVDVELRALQKPGRLIAGQFARDSRPTLQPDGQHATLRFDRRQTPWLSLADWQIAMARDLPWTLYVSTHLGQVSADFAGLILDHALIATGIGDIRCVTPDESLDEIVLRSTLGSINVITPPSVNAQITVAPGLTFTAHVDETRYEPTDEPNIYLSRDPAPDAPLVRVHVSGGFGDAYLS